MIELQPFLQQLRIPDPNSHKGQNGKLLIIGGSELFHAASKWSLDIASKFVDMVFYASVPTNNDIVKAAKGEFWNGLVIPREQLEDYLEEADCVLIGPGMMRQEPAAAVPDRDWSVPLTPADWNDDTQKIVNYLLSRHPDHKWVIDAGALQMVEPQLLNERCIITPHQKEYQMVLAKTSEAELKQTGVTIVLKGAVDRIMRGSQTWEIVGGNAGMTKGGTGDVLAGLIAALYCQNDTLTAAVVGSYVNKQAGDSLYQQVGPYFNASDLVEEIPRTLWRLLESHRS